MINLKNITLSKNVETNQVDALPKKKKIRNQNNLLVFMIVITMVALLFTVYFTAQLIKIENEDDRIDTNIDTDIFWDIEMIQSNPQNSQNFNLTVMSNAGQLRVYEDLISFGLSRDGHKLAVNSTKGLEIITLNDDSRKLITPPLEQFAGDSGNVISWNFDTNYFAISIVNTKSFTDTRIWIFDSNGQLFKEIQTHIPVKQSEKALVEPVQFASANNALLSRTYKVVDSLELKEDGNQYSLYELPAYLTVYDLNGKIVKDIMIRDFDTTGTQIYLSWDLRNPKLVKYGIFGKSEPIDPSLEYKFTKISI